MKRLLWLQTMMIGTALGVFAQDRDYQGRIAVEPGEDSGGAGGAIIYDVMRTLSQDVEFYTFDIEPGIVEKVEVFWHDDLGHQSKALGQVYLRVKGRRAVLKTSHPNPRYGPLFAEIQRVAHRSLFYPDYPLRCDGQVVLRAYGDDMFVEYFRVYYTTESGPSQTEGGGSHEDYSEPERDVTRLEVNAELSNEEEYHEFEIPRGTVRKIEIYWHDNLGENANARGRVYLNRVAVMNLLTPSERDRRYSAKVAEVQREGNKVTFTPPRPIYSEGMLIVQIFEDDAFIHYIDVYYQSRRPRRVERPDVPPPPPAPPVRPRDPWRFWRDRW